MFFSERRMIGKKQNKTSTPYFDLFTKLTKIFSRIQSLVTSYQKQHKHIYSSAQSKYTNKPMQQFFKDYSHPYISSTMAHVSKSN